MELLSVMDSCHVAQSCQMSNSVWLKAFDFKRLPKHHMAPLVKVLQHTFSVQKQLRVQLCITSSRCLLFASFSSKIDCISMFNARPRRSSILLVLSSSNSKNWIKSEVKVCK
ncbi:hypothetical protein POUND7_008546 [Theobroma cacao]